MDKKLFKNNKGEFHYGVNPPSEDFVDAEKSEAKEILSNLNEKILWRCTVCNDLFLGITPPEVCPTCQATDAYVEINEQEYLTLLEA